MAQPSGRVQAWTFLVAAGAMVAFAGGGCGSKSRPEDKARVDACVLTGATTNDGCDLSAGGSAEIKLGDLTSGALKTRDVALFNGGAGQVAATIGDVQLDAGGGSAANYAILKIFKLDATSAEVAVALPYDLAVNHGSELRVRVAFTANAAVGAVSGVSVKVVATHPAVSVVIPITGQITGCPTGHGDCDSDPSNGCEADLQTTLSNCGACGTACGESNATSACVAGTCQITCATGFGNCDGNAANGCETDLSTTPTHCASCGNACSSTNGTASCTAGTCGIVCNAGFADCDGVPSNGCEVTLATDASHCGACGTVCNSTNGTATCTAGICGLTCSAGFADCDGSAANGCEVNLATNAASCGACGTVCNSTNGTATCTASTCGIICSAGFANCDGLTANGCEVNVAADPANCGGCGTVCNSTNGTATCTASVCGTTCNAGFANCDGSAANGCEVNLAADLLNCGSCGTACGTANASASCSAGACGLVCLAGHADCDGVNSDGCETNAVTDVNNCGGCGNVCNLPHATAACSLGGCTVSACNAGFYDMDGTAADGCECAADGNSGACASSTALGSIDLGLTTTVSGSLVPNLKEDWFQVTFPSNTSMSYHPKITVTSATGVVKFDVLSNCSGTAAGSCGTEGGTSIARTAWETLYTGGDPSNFYGQFQPIPPPGVGGTVLVRVYSTVSTGTCGTYTLTISN